MKKYFSVFLALVIIAVSLCSCGANERETELYYPVSSDFITLDPQIVNDVSGKIIAYNCFEGLMRVDKDGKVVPAGAESYNVSSDSLTYVFNLRKDAKWYLTNTSKEELSDEDPDKSPLPENFDDRVTAKDYVFGLRRAVDPATGSWGGKYLSSIKNAKDVLNGKKNPSEIGAEALDDFTLKITLEREDPDFLYYLTRLASTPCNESFFNACKGRYGLSMEYTLCNGAYMVFRWTLGSVIRLEKNKLYTGPDKAKNTRVWVYYTGDAPISEKLKEGPYFAGYVTAEESLQFKNKENYTLTPRSDVLWGYWFNFKSDIFSSSNMRNAFASSVDKSVLIPPDYIEKPYDRLLLSSLSPFYDFAPKPLAYNEEAAGNYYKSALLNDENINDEDTVTILTCDDFSDGVKEQIQLWQKILGIDVKIKSLERQEALALFNAGDYELAFMPLSVTAGSSAEFFRMFASSSDYNVAGYENPDYDKALNSMSLDMDSQKISEVYKNLEQTLISDCVVVPAFTEASYFVVNSDVQGVYSFSDGEVYFRDAVLV